MMLPILFRRRRNPYAAPRQRPYSYYRTRRRGAPGCALWSLPVLLLVAVAAWVAGYLYPVSEERMQAARDSIIVESHYVIMADSTEVETFLQVQGDSLLLGVDHTDSDTMPAVWVRRYDWLPFSGPYMVAKAYDRAAFCNYSPRRVKQLLQRQIAILRHNTAIAERQWPDIDYYLRTHSVHDNGFDLVLRYKTECQARLKSMAKRDSLYTRALSADSLSIVLRQTFYTRDSMGNKRQRITLKQERDGLVSLYVPDSLCDAPNALLRPRQSVARTDLEARHPKKQAPLSSAIDKRGLYSGGRDSNALPHGYGCFLAHNGEYYEGDWHHGKRQGIGLQIAHGKKLMVGEWQDDAFRGDKITYTPHRIYGIDISRYQHEKKKKKYSINWKDLRITSLGTRTKKNISGTVDYPVSFVYIKATESTSIRNRYFPTDYVQSRRHGYRTGAYHFYSTRTTGSAQARYFLKYARYNKGDLPPVLDLEPTDARIRQSGGTKTLFANIRAWLHTVEKAWGVKPVLYVSQRFLNKYLTQEPDLLKDYDVWIARYSEYLPEVRLLYWQLSCDGKVRGIHGDVDINVYNGFNF